jgi:Tfp pilus assembly protein PilF
VPDLAEAHASLGMVRHFERNMPAAEREFKKAIDLNSNYSMAHHFYSAYLLGQGRAAEALAENNRALQLDPFSIPINSMHGNIFANSRQFSQAVAQFERTAEIIPQSPSPHYHLARIYWLQGQANLGIAEETKAATLARSSGLLRDQEELAREYAQSGLRAARLKSAQLTEAHYRCNYGSISMAFRFGTLEDGTKVLHWLEEGLSEDASNVLLRVRTAPEFDFLRSDPRFQTFVRRLNVPEEQ